MVPQLDAIVSPGKGFDFREFAVFYHEVGNENFNARKRDGSELDAIEPITVTYKPSGRAINYRSESFHNRLIDMDAAHPDFYDEFQPDVALAYSSYTFGDPVTPIPQSYLGDPVKFRLIHGGSETFHVPHLHGGGVQWQRQPQMGAGEANYVALNAGLQKQFASSMPSSATDSPVARPVGDLRSGNWLRLGRVSAVGRRLPFSLSCRIPLYRWDVALLACLQHAPGPRRQDR